MGRPACFVALYHGLSTGSDGGYRDDLPLADFSAQIDWVCQHYAVVPLDDLFLRMRAGRQVSGLAALTFDDGARSAAPALALLKSRDLPATLFLVGDVLDGKPFWRDLARSVMAAGRVKELINAAGAVGIDVGGLTEENFYRASKNPDLCDVKALAEFLPVFCKAGAPERFLTEQEILALAWPGLTLGNHTQRHLPLSSLEESDQRRDIGLVEERLNAFPVSRSRLLSVPFGGPGSYNAATWRAAEACGLAGLALTLPGIPDARDPAPKEYGHVPTLMRGLLGKWRVSSGSLHLANAA